MTDKGLSMGQGNQGNQGNQTGQFNPNIWIGAYIEFSKVARLYPPDSQRGHMARRYLAQMIAAARMDVAVYDKRNGLESA